MHVLHGDVLSQPPCPRIGQVQRRLPSTDAVAVSRAPYPESIPNSLSSVTAMVRWRFLMWVTCEVESVTMAPQVGSMILAVGRPLSIAIATVFPKCSSLFGRTFSDTCVWGSFFLERSCTCIERCPRSAKRSEPLLSFGDLVGVTEQALLFCTNSSVQC